MRSKSVSAWLVGHVLVASVVGALGCPRPASNADTDTTSNAPVSPVADSARVVRLEREARALAKTTGCDAAGHCQTAPVGERPCGGPRDYVVYCARSTDTSALNRKLAELRQAEMELNKKTGAMSTCEFRMPPDVALVGGNCRAR